MAVSQGDGTLCFVLLLCCWQETELRPRTVIPGSPTEIPFSSKQEDMSELLEANANANLHGDPSENYRGPQVSPGSEKSVSSKADGISLHTELPGVGRGVIPALSWPPQLAPMLGLTQSPTAAQTSTVPELIQEKNSKNTQYENLSILDQILQNIGRSSGNIFHKEQQRTSAQRRSQGSQ
ncbi:sperm acrosome-associated protein 7 isoform X5 [Homo sapiens]|uniref:sperm acrosome-associated protein 7 isoform X5 n=1 Tax=Homo sapiens TaxID=9606 RepID=UPI001FB174A4|nr:sperm acrosome-associated protein 7 isoform X5 [Homo sapiens]XP_054184918.1 sperm acrosome-associated protein 7 isoform X5 [Homo sapiens]XP_054230085.1 sperm acrosome-associated protein 7 isoform X5 [Homo sapiens]